MPGVPLLTLCFPSHDLQSKYYNPHIAQETECSERLGHLSNITQLINRRVGLSRPAYAFPGISWGLWKGNLLCGKGDTQMTSKTLLLIKDLVAYSEEEVGGQACISERYL